MDRNSKKIGLYVGHIMALMVVVFMGLILGRKWDPFGSWILHVLIFRMPIWDPEQVLNKVSKKFKSVFSQQTFGCNHNLQSVSISRYQAAHLDAAVFLHSSC